MSTVKLKEALVDLQRQRTILDGAITHLQNVIAMLDGEPQNSNEQKVEKRPTSYIDEGILILEQAGKPLHISEIARRIGHVRQQEDISRASVESSFIRHIATKGSKARVVKVSPGHFGLPSWKSLLPLSSQSDVA